MKTTKTAKANETTKGKTKVTFVLPGSKSQPATREQWTDHVRINLDKARRSLRCYYEVGRGLHKIRFGDKKLGLAKIEHGEWGPYLEEHFNHVSSVQARKYIRLYKGWKDVEAHYQSYPDLGLEEALKLLRKEVVVLEGEKAAHGLLPILQIVSTGLDPREIIEQSHCFALKGGEVFTFNDDIAVRCSTGLDPSIEGAVGAKPLLELLELWGEHGGEVTQEDGCLVVSGKSKLADFNVAREIYLRYDEVVSKPTSWKPLPPDFCDAIGLVARCAHTDETKNDLVCVHLHPERIEATDTFHAARWLLKVPVEESTLIRGQSIKPVTNMFVTEMSVNGEWVHFRNPIGLVYSCRRCVREYSDISAFFKGKGEKVRFPKALIQALARAEVFSKRNVDGNLVKCELSEGKIVVTGESKEGRYREVLKVTYAGPRVEFMIPPDLLAEVVREGDEPFIVSNDKNCKMKIKRDSWVYVIALEEPDPWPKPQPKPRDDEGTDESEDTEEDTTEPAPSRIPLPVVGSDPPSTPDEPNYKGSKDSLDKIIPRYFACLTKQPFTYKGFRYEPGPITVTPDLLRGYTCPSDCGGCCRGFSLDYLPSEDMPPEVARRVVEFDGREVVIYSDMQERLKLEDPCRHLQDDGRCGIYTVRPFSCDFELVKLLGPARRTLPSDGSPL